MLVSCLVSLVFVRKLNTECSFFANSLIIYGILGGVIHFALYRCYLGRNFGSGIFGILHVVDALFLLFRFLNGIL